MILVRFINENSGFLTLVFSAVVTLSTVAYAVLTWKLVKETILLREAETEPMLSVFIAPNVRFNNIIDLVIRNHGRGAALDISWKVSPSPDDLAAHGVELHSLALLEGLSQLAPAQELRSLFGNAISLLKAPVAPDIVVTCHYRSPSGKNFSTAFHLTAAQFRGIGTVGQDPAERIARHLERIERALSRIASGRLDH